MSVHATGPSDVVFLDQREDGFVVWTVEPENLDVTALRVVAVDDAKGTRLEIEPTPTLRKRARAALLYTLGVIGLLAVFLMPWVGASVIPGLLVLAMTLALAWGTRQPYGSIRPNLAWSELSEALAQLALPTTRDAGPYRP
jgi:hypothetical protein